VENEEEFFLAFIFLDLTTGSTINFYHYAILRAFLESNILKEQEYEKTSIELQGTYNRNQNGKNFTQQ